MKTKATISNHVTTGAPVRRGFLDWLFERSESCAVLRLRVAASEGRAERLEREVQLWRLKQQVDEGHWMQERRDAGRQIAQLRGRLWSEKGQWLQEREVIERGAAKLLEEIGRLRAAVARLEAGLVGTKGENRGGAEGAEGAEG